MGAYKVTLMLMDRLQLISPELAVCISLLGNFLDTLLRAESFKLIPEIKGKWDIFFFAFCSLN